MNKLKCYKVSGSGYFDDNTDEISVSVGVAEFMTHSELLPYTYQINVNDGVYVKMDNEPNGSMIRYNVYGYVVAHSADKAIIKLQRSLKNFTVTKK